MTPDQRSHRGSRPQKRNTKKKRSTSTVDFVREGVRRFILSDASIGEFHKALRSAVRAGRLSPNPLTGLALQKIVKEAISERKRQAKKRRER